MPEPDTPRYAAPCLLDFARNLLTASGLPPERAGTVAEILLEGDLLGHTTHGLQLLKPYLDSLQAGTMERSGDPAIVTDRGGLQTWDGRHLPGPWLVRRAIASAIDRARTHGQASVAIRRSHHIACLQAYLKPVVDEGFMILLMSSDPAVATVAPHGGIDPVFTPNPIAVGIPTAGEPILIDISTSTTSNGFVMRCRDEGRPLPGPWVRDASGRPTDNPNALFTKPPGTVMPLGGTDAGHKGYALALMVEAFTSGLSGWGRARHPDRWGASVYLQVTDPEAFGGRETFVEESGFLAAACAGSRVPPGADPVRLPGAQALHRRSEQLENGVALHPGILPGLAAHADRLGVAAPDPLPQ